MVKTVRALTARAPRPEFGVFVLGTNNSGTSAVARLINLMGVPINREDDWLFPTRENPKGYWESEALNKFHDRLWQHEDWNDAPLLPEGWEKAWHLRKMVGEARLAFQSAYGDLSYWVWKDPRTSITFPFWKHALQPERSRIVAVYRNPLAVALSFEKNYGLDKIYSLHLWRLFNERIWSYAKTTPVLWISFETLLDHSVFVAGSIRRYLASSGMNIGEPLSVSEIESWIDSDQTRHSATRADLYSDPDVTLEVRSLYDRLHAARVTPSENV